MTPWGPLGEPVLAPLKPALCFGPRYMVICSQSGVIGMLGDWWMFLLVLVIVVAVAIGLGWYMHASMSALRERRRSITADGPLRLDPGDGRVDAFDPRPPARRAS